jgi:hypothetical protein
MTSPVDDSNPVYQFVAVAEAEVVRASDRVEEPEGE